VNTFCELFGFSKQAYYKQGKAKVHSSKELIQAKSAVLQIRRLLPRLGTRKLQYILKEELSIGRDKLFSLLRQEGLLITRKKRYTITTNSKHWMFKYPNIIKDIHLTGPEQLWVADITYLDTLEGNIYLHLITDAYSKQIMGYELCSNMEAVSTAKALGMAVKNRQYPENSLIHHSDRGLQYCSKLYVNMLKENAIQISMTENGSPYENAVAERINGILKDEFGLAEQLNDLKGAIRQTSQSIGLYNNMRPHLSCQMLTPLQMHQQQEIKIKTYKKTSNIFENV